MTLKHVTVTKLNDRKIRDIKYFSSTGSYNDDI